MVIVSTDTACKKLYEDFVEDREVSISGLGGAVYILCETKQCDWTNLTYFEEGFPINQINTVKLYNQLISKSNNDEIQQ